MTAGKQRYKWQDPVKYPEPVDLPAIQYMEELLNWANGRLNDEKFCPIAPGVPFPEDFESGIKMMFRRFFRVYAHIYHHQYKEMEKLELHAHLNHVFKRFILFNMVFKLLPPEELEPLKDLVDQLWSSYAQDQKAAAQ
jgi:MOB kinase activator 1